MNQSQCSNCTALLDNRDDFCRRCGSRVKQHAGPGMARGRRLSLLLYGLLFLFSAAGAYLLYGDGSEARPISGEKDGGVAHVEPLPMQTASAPKGRASRRPKRRGKGDGSASKATPAAQRPDGESAPDAGGTPDVHGVTKAAGRSVADASAGSASRGDASTTSASPVPGPQTGRAELEAQGVQMVVRHYAPQIRLCSDRAAKKMPKLAGRVEVRFVVGENGRVRSAEASKNTTGHEGLGLCIAHTIKRWKFPKPAAGTATYVYPFEFSLKNHE